MIFEIERVYSNNNIRNRESLQWLTVSASPHGVWAS